MAGVTYKCPNCGSYLAFNPDQQNWKCASCGSVFDEKTLLQKAAEYRKEAEGEQAESEPVHEHTHEPEPGAQVVYHCPSCGSEIITDETTVATQCYYCHNPVVLQGKLTAEHRPQQVLPFSIGKDKAIERFMEWIAKKRFVPKGFFAREQVKKMEGVYYPHFVSDCTLDGDYEGEGRTTTVMDIGREIVTTTKHYAFKRRADITFHNVIRPALKSTNRKLSDGIHPFPLDEVKPFSGAYLSGFLAERRDMSEADATADVEGELQDYVKPLLDKDLHYTTHSGHTQARLESKECRYVLLPSWVLTYPEKGEKEPYYYAMNGRTGKVCGKLPINKAKLRAYGLGLAVVCFAVYCVAAYFLF